MNRLIDTAVHCSICGTQGVGNCDCWITCQCGWSYPRGAESLLPQPCKNPVHRAPPRDVICPYCDAAVGQACVQRNGIRQGWPHRKRISASEKGQ